MINKQELIGTFRWPAGGHKRNKDGSDLREGGGGLTIIAINETNKAISSEPVWTETAWDCMFMGLWSRLQGLLHFFFLSAAVKTCRQITSYLESQLQDRHLFLPYIHLFLYFSPLPSTFPRILTKSFERLHTAKPRVCSGEHVNCVSHWS